MIPQDMRGLEDYPFGIFGAAFQKMYALVLAEERRTD